MKSIEITAKTVEDAIDTALKELKVQREDVEVEVLEEPSKGLFGILGSRMAKVKVSIKETPGQLAAEFLNNVLQKMGMKVTIDSKQHNDYLYLTISGSNLGILIGRRGETLDSLQYLTNLVANRQSKNRVHVVLDIENYRRRREQTLVKLAQRLSDRVKRTGNSITLEPMNPHERRIIHTALQNDTAVHTFSQGEEPFRKVTIALKNKAK
ncbi:RNA-binding cell elongation regulator Jag/EloR [Zhaonella formicivorans]|uniref:RNA-binding cell elongation regulator Jag/EloR n=1 Tax=Zhaonella formicivorans TaxID=2528593 RepID=UPI0010E59BEC|nr:RNA-binding cell elongation regulator Jag/EloR [Zhaonella formicivorans]